MAFRYTLEGTLRLILDLVTISYLILGVWMMIIVMERPFDDTRYGAICMSNKELIEQALNYDGITPVACNSTKIMKYANISSDISWIPNSTN